MSKCRENWRRKRIRAARNLQKNKAARLKFVTNLFVSLNALQARGVINII